MADTTMIRFDDGAEYEDFMGRWSRTAGEAFLDWLAPSAGWRWLDVGCGNGAFTALLAERCAPASLHGVDPSAAQIDFARTRPGLGQAGFAQGVATELPHPDGAFDAAAMALVIFFVPDPVRGVAEMARVVRPGGSVSAYVWDALGGGFPYAVLNEEMEAAGLPPLWPPSVEASRMDVLRGLWVDAGLLDVETRTIVVERTFPDFETWWRIARNGPPIAPRLAGLPPAAVEGIRQRVEARAPADATGQVRFSGRANAIKGRVPG